MTGTQYNYFPSESGKRSRPTAREPSPRLSAIRGILQRNQDLLRNAGSLAASTGVTSVLGFGYWIYAARFFPVQAVGYGSAAISTMMLLSTIGMFGLGTMLIGELPQRESRGGLMMAGIIASFIASLVLGFGFSFVSLAFGNHFVEISGTFVRMAVFSFGVAITSATFVFDDATIGLMRGGLQLNRNVAFSIAKILALPASSLILHDLFGLGIMLSWVLSTVVSLVPVFIMIKRGGSSILHRPDWRAFWEVRKVTLSHNWLNLAIQTPVKLIPVLVAIVVSPSSNAAFYVAFMLVSFLTMVPQHLSTVLFAIASAAPQMIAEKLRFVLRMSVLFGIPGGVVLGLSAHLALSVFGARYASLATVPLWLLIAGYVPGVPNTVYIAVCRATGRVNQAAIFLSVTAAIQMAVIWVGGKLDGLEGVTLGMLAVAVLQALVTAPSVLRTAYGSAPARAATAPAYRATPAGPAVDARHHVRLREADDAMRLRQEAGLAALFSLATAVAPGRSRTTGTSRRVGEAAPWLAPAAPPRTSAAHGNGHRRHRAAAVTTADRALRNTGEWADVDEATFHTRQEAGMAALIAIATHAARF
jgi:O-antigen/teichoic acid export membrane protein